MFYYVLDKNNEIKLFDTDKELVENTILTKPELKDQPILETEREIVNINDHYVFADEHQEEVEEYQQFIQEQITQRNSEFALRDLKDRMATADLQGNEEWKAELRQEYAELMGE